MKTIFAVCSGSYSDWRIDAMFSTEKLAEEYIKFNKNISKDKQSIMTFNLDPEFNQEKEGLGFKIFMDKEGNTYNNLLDYDFKYFENRKIDNTWTYSDKEELNFDKEILIFHIITKTEKQAIKIANEKRLQIIAGNQWDNYFKDDNL